MTYETWFMVSSMSVLGVLILPIALAIAVYIRQRGPRSVDGKRTGRPLAWASAALVSSFIALIIAWGLTLEEGFPEYVARRDAELAASRGTTPSEASSPEVIDGVVGSWRPNNANRSDYFRFTERTYSSVNPEFDTIVTYRYRLVRRAGPCMRIQPSESEVSQGGEVTQRSSRRQSAFTVCVDPETDQMLMRFDNDRGDVFFTRMN